METTITNYRRRRKWGWGWSATLTGKDAYSFEVPAAPDYVGTLNQLDTARAADATLNSLGGACNTAYFWDGKRITHTWAFINRTPFEIPDSDPADYADYGYAWVAGFHPGRRGESDVKLLLDD